jgi:hypothetical protein
MPQSTDNIFDSLFLMHKGALIEPYSHWHSPIKQIVDIFLVPLTLGFATAAFAFATASLVLKKIFTEPEAAISTHSPSMPNEPTIAFSLAVTASFALSIFTIPVATTLGFFTRAISTVFSSNISDDSGIDMIEREQNTGLGVYN